MSHQRRTAADYGQLSLFEEPDPEWLQPATESTPVTADRPETSAPPSEDDDDLSHFMHWLQTNR